MFDDVGRPRHERMDETSLRDSDDFRNSFEDSVASLAQGDLTFPAPFDLVSSWALARNNDNGAAALESFARDANNSNRRFLIRIHAQADDGETDAEQEIFDAIVTGLAAAAETLSMLAVDMVHGSGHSFRIRINELPPTDQPAVGEREIVDTIVNGRRVAAQILVGVATEMVEGQTR